MLKIFVMALIFSVEIFTSLAFAKPRIMVLEEGTEDLSMLAAEFVEEILFDSGRFDLIMNDEEWQDFNEKFPEYAGIKKLTADYVAVSQLKIEQASRGKKFKITQRVDFVEDNVVIWSGESNKIFNASKATPLDWHNALYKLSSKIVKKFLKAADSGKVILKA